MVLQHFFAFNSQIFIGNSFLAFDIRTLACWIDSELLQYLEQKFSISKIGRKGGRKLNMLGDPPRYRSDKLELIVKIGGHFLLHGFNPSIEIVLPHHKPQRKRDWYVGM